MIRRVSLVMLCALGAGAAACGDDDHAGRLPDAAAVNDAAAGSDSAVEIAPVTVVVTLAGAPAKQAQVYFQNVDSTLVSDTKTGDDGKAHAIMAAGGFVTVLEPQLTGSGSGSGNSHFQISTFAGVVPGDVLHLDLGASSQPAPKTISVTVAVPNEQLGNEYRLYTTCGSGTIGRGNGQVRGPASRSARLAARAIAIEPVQTAIELVDCNGTADMLVVSVDVNNEVPQVTGWQYKPAVALTDGGTVTFADGYNDPVDASFSYTKVPDTIDRISVFQDLRTARGFLFGSGAIGNGTSDAFVEAGTATTSLRMPAPPGVTAITTSAANPNTGSGQQTVIAWGPEAATYSLAYGDLALASYATIPTFDPAHHATSWTESPGTTADFVLGVYGASRSDQTQFRSWDWRIVAPYVAGQPTLTYPVLPTTVYDYNAVATDNPNVGQLTTAKVPGGYDVARPVAFDNVALVAGASATGTTIYQNMFFQPQATVRAAALRRPAARKRFTPPAR